MAKNLSLIAIGATFCMLFVSPWQQPSNRPPPDADQKATPSQSDVKANESKHSAYDASTRLLLDFAGTPAHPPSPPLLSQWAQAVGLSPLTYTSNHVLQSLSKRCTVDCLIATIPDPIDSRMDYAFDHNFAALLSAHEAAGFLLHSKHLPWPTPTTASAGAPASIIDRTAHVQPLYRTAAGVLLFRHSSLAKLRVLFLVGEVPTSGIHHAAFQDALAQRSNIERRFRHTRSCASDIQIVGPCFSGSGPSLWTALEVAPNTSLTVTAISGSATTIDPESVRERAEGRIVFHTTLHCDTTLQQTLDAQIIPNLRLEQKEVAYLHETSTSYGARESGDDHSISIGFPMGIGSLRSAYQREWDKSPAATQRTPLPLDMEVREAEGELPQPHSRLTPAAIDLVLAEILRTLNQHDIKLVVLNATDARDTVFLGNLIAKRLPDVQLLTYSSSLLYLRSELSVSQRGMLVLSTYPLFATPPDWATTPARRRLHDVFPSEDAQGTYNATLLQLGRQELLADYWDPLSLERSPLHVPPIWLTCVGKTSLLPVTHYPQRPTSLLSRSAQPYQAFVELPTFQTHPEPPTLALVLLLLVATATTSYFANRTRQALLAPPPSIRRAPPALGAFVSASMVCSVLSVCSYAGWALGTLCFLAAAAALASIEVSIWVFVFWLFGLKRPDLKRLYLCANTKNLASWVHYLASGASVGVMLFIGLSLLGWAIATAALPIAHRELMYHRVIALGELVTPLACFAIAATACCLRCHWSARHAEWLRDPGAPHYPDKRQDPRNRRVETPWPLWIVAIIGPAALVIEFRGATTIDGLVDSSYLWLGMSIDSVLLFATTAWLLMTTALGAYRILKAWGGLRATLNVKTSVAQAIERLSKQYGFLISIDLWYDSNDSRIDDVARDLRERQAPVCDLSLCKVLDDEREAAGLCQMTVDALRQIRILGHSVMGSLLCSAALLWAYPFHPHGNVRIAFLMLSALVVGTLTHVVIQINGNTMLNQLAKPDERGTLSLRFLTDSFAYIVVPLLAMIAGLVPEFGTAIFSIVEPLVKSVLATR